MADEKDELADALAALAAGHHDDPEGGEADVHGEHNTAHVGAIGQAGPGPLAPPPPPAGAIRPAGPGMKPVAKAVAPPAAVTPNAGGRAGTPAPAPRASAPQAPAREPAFVVEAESKEGAEGSDWGTTEARADDDTMMAPRPDPQMLGHVRSRKTAVSTSNIKRTMIPILLTIGMLLILFGALKYVRGPDSPYAALPGSIVITAFGGGAVLLVFAVLNMLQVKAEMAQAAAAKGKAGR